MKLLIIGGSRFLGKHLVISALSRGHEVTLFNRGQSNPDLFPDIEKLQGDRNTDLSALHNRRWDAVIDTCGYFPRQVRASAQLLADAVDHYSFISTISVYRDDMPPGYDESGPLRKLEDESTEAVTNESYGGLKVLCEQAAEAAMPGRVLTIRPGLIVGPDDPTDRFTYWPLRIARGGEVLAPGRPDAPVQFIDVRDLAEWHMRMVEEKVTGVYHATGPDYRLDMAQLLAACQTAIEAAVTLTWVDEAFLLEHEVGPFVEMPLWLPEAVLALTTANCDKAFTAGLTIHPLADTVRDTLAWARSGPANTPLRAGLTAAREEELLAAWRQRNS